MRDSPSVSHIAARWLGAVLLVAGSVVMSAQTPPLTLVSTAWSPFTNEPGQPRFALDLVEAALGRFGATAKTTIVSAANSRRRSLADDSTAAQPHGRTPSASAC